MEKGEAQNFSSDEKFNGLTGKTRIAIRIFPCECGTRFSVKTFVSVNAEERPDLVEKVFHGKLNETECPNCKRKIVLNEPFIYHDPWKKLFVLVIPEYQRHLELSLRAGLLNELSQDQSEIIPDYVINFHCVFGTDSLKLLLESPPPDHASIKALQEEIKKAEKALKEKENRISQLESAITQKESELTRREQSISIREQKIRERGEKITEQEDVLRDREEQLNQKEAELEILSSKLKEWEKNLIEKEKSIEEFSKTLEAVKKRETTFQKFITKEENTRTPPKTAKLQPERSSWFVSNKTEKTISPTLISSIETILQKNGDENPLIEPEKTLKTLAPKAIEINESDVVEEADIIDEADIIEEKPIVPIPLKESKDEILESTFVHPLVKSAGEKVIRELKSKRRKSISILKDRTNLWCLTSRNELLDEKALLHGIPGVHLIKDSGGFPWIILSLYISSSITRTTSFFTIWKLNIKDPENYRIIKYLEKNFEIAINMVEEKGKKVTSAKIGAPLAHNVKQIASDAEKMLEENSSLIPEHDIDEDSIATNLRMELKANFPFHSTYLMETTSLRKILEALNEIANWSIPPLYSRLVHIFSYPLIEFAAIKKRAILLALQNGLFVPEQLWIEAPLLGITLNKRETLKEQIKAFQKICQQETDLTTEEKKSNWEKLLNEAKAISLPLDVEEALTALNFVEESYLQQENLQEIKNSLDSDIEKADVSRLELFLGTKLKRVEAALEIIRRGETNLQEKLLLCIKNMNCEEFKKILPSILKNEDLMEIALLKGLESQDRNVKLISAAHLGKLKLRSSIIPLIKLMMESPEPDWKFITWIITSFGLSGLRSAEKFINDPGVQEQKVIYLMSAFIASGMEKQVHNIISEPNLLIKSMIDKAAKLAPDILTEGDELKKKIIAELGIDLQ